MADTPEVLSSYRHFVELASGGILTADADLVFGLRHLTIRTADGSPLPTIDSDPPQPIAGIITDIFVGYRPINRRNKTTLREIRDAVRSIIVERFSDCEDPQVVFALQGFERHCGLTNN